MIRTHDERDKDQPFKPFPSHLEYLHAMVDLLDSEERLLVVEKSSQMMCTTIIFLHSAWDCAFHEGRRIMCSKHKQLESEAILRDKVRTPWSLLPEWVQYHVPCSVKPADQVRFPKTQSMMWGLGENAAAAELRGTTATRTLLDEACYQDNLPELITAAKPRARQIVMWSTPALAGMGEYTFKKFLQ